MATRQTGTKAPVEPESDTIEPEKTVFVRYVDAQHFEERRISVRDFAKAGVQDAEEVVWDRSNGFMVRKDRLRAFMDEAQYQSIILADSRLEEVEA